MMVLNFFTVFFVSLLGFTPKIETSPIALCDGKPLIDKCIQTLPAGYIFSKSYTVDGQGGAKKVLEYVQVLNANTTYLISIAKGQTSVDKLVIRLKDATGKEVANNYNQGKYYAAIAFACKQTNKYTITYTFETGTNDFCAGSVLAFKR
ncbi:MAG: hypothetical protein EAZ55_14170 [Cytophagales bacterium]|nr:MAG: hypothetical protein EAZ55_14170 [Cytophagales bacterium]